ncbi:MAG: hypothetical protein MI723_09325, partial [Caulobacterales bacterium]|nr:hypothetical protein [Caulobacterales bacterium]
MLALGCAKFGRQPPPTGAPAPDRAARAAWLPPFLYGPTGAADIGPTDSAPAEVEGFIKRAAPSQPSDGADGDGAERDADAEAAPQPAEEITLEFDDAHLASVVRILMEEGLQANYIMDPGVSGKVTIRTNRPLSSEEVLPTLEEILRMNNAALVERDGTFRVVPRAEAGLSAPFITSRDAAARGLSVRVTPLRYVSVEDVADVLEGFAPVTGSLRYDRARDLVFSTGTAAEQATIMDAIEALDVNYFAGRSFALRPLREAEPQVVSDELVAAFARPSGAPNPAIRFVPVRRMNAVLVIAEEPALLDEALSLARNLDQGGGETPRLHVIPVAQRRASELAVILGDIFGAEVSGVTGGAGF